MNLQIKMYQLQVKEIMTVCCPWAWLCHQLYFRAKLLGPTLSFSTISSVTGRRELDALLRFSLMMTPSSSAVTNYSTTDGKHPQAIPIKTIYSSTDCRDSLRLNTYRSVLPTIWFHCPTNNISKSVGCKDRKASKDTGCWSLPSKTKRKSERKPGWWNKPQHTAERTGWLLRGPGGREGVCRRGSERPSWRTPLY